jgi:hypothetical protein
MTRAYKERDTEGVPPRKTSPCYVSTRAMENQSLLYEYSCHHSRVLNLLARPANGHLIHEVRIA